MAKVAVGLWTRDTHDYSIPTKDTLRDLEKVVGKTRDFAKQNGIAAEPGKLRSIFVAPEFLFTQQRKKGDHSGTTAISKYDRDIALEKILEISEASPSMLLIPGTIVFGESYKSAWGTWEDKKTTDPTRENPFARARKNLVQAANPVPIKDPGKALPPRFKKPEEISKALLTARKPYPTKEAPESDQHTEGFRKFYNNQIEELTEAEKLMVQKDSKKISQYFFIKNRTYVFFDKKKIFSYGKKTNMGDYAEDESKGIFVPGRKEGITTIDGLKIGFEICFDHDFGTLSDHMGGATGKSLDLHIICSAEVPNDPSKCMAKPGGYLLHASTGSGGQEHTAVFKQGKPWTKLDSQPVGGDFGGHLRLYVIEVGA